MSATSKQNNMCHKLLKLQVATLREKTEDYTKTLFDFLKKVQSDVEAFDFEAAASQRQFGQTYAFVQQTIECLISNTQEFKGAIKTRTKNPTPLKLSMDCNSEETVQNEDMDYETKLAVSREVKATDQIMKKIKSLENDLIDVKETSTDFQEKLEDLEDAIKFLKCEQDEINKQINLYGTKKEEKSKEMHTELNDSNNVYYINQDKIKTLEQEMKLVRISLEDLTLQMSSMKSFEKDAILSFDYLTNAVQRSKANIETFSHRTKKLEEEFDDLSCKLYEEQGNASKISVEKIETLETKYGTLCQIVFKRLASLEKIKNEVDRRWTLTDRNTSRINEMEVKIKLMASDIEDIDLKAVEPLIGFSVSAQVDLPPHSDFLKDFKRQCSLQGVTLDETKGLYPISVSGFYCISASIKYKYTGSSTIVCYTTKECNDETQAPECKVLFRLKGDESVTYFTELSKGDLMHLDLQDSAKHEYIQMRFSCALIKRYG